MIDWLKLTPEQRKTTIEQAAARAGLPAKAVEKDWWVTLTLKAMFTGSYREYIIFKGGTSLSKCWNLIERFSEDIDIALDSRAFGVEYSEDPVKKYISELKRKGCIFTSNELKKDIEDQFEKWGIPNAVKIEAAEVKAGVPDTDPQTLYVIYESLFDPNPYLADQVKIEVSVRSLKEPKAVVKIQSVLTTEFPGSAYPEEPFEVTAVEAHRTFLEKAFLLHEEFLRPDKTKIRIERMSRHLYDLERMMDHDSGKKALNDDELYHSIIKHRENYSSLSWVDYKTLHRETISFVLPEELIEPYKKDYSAMTEQMIYGESVSFDKLLARISELLNRFRSIAEKSALKVVKVQPEYPPYEFYRKTDEAKYDTWNVDVDEKYNTFRLHNFTLSPIELQPQLSMTVTVDDRLEKKVYTIQLSDLHYNPVHKENLFFLDGEKKHVDIPLPRGRKWVTIKITPSNNSKEFNAKLACEYVR